MTRSGLNLCPAHPFFRKYTHNSRDCSCIGARAPRATSPLGRGTRRAMPHYEADDENDIVMCDKAGCFRAYHVACSEPPILPEELEYADDDGDDGPRSPGFSRI